MKERQHSILKKHKTQLDDTKQGDYVYKLKKIFQQRKITTITPRDSHNNSRTENKNKNITSSQQQIIYFPQQWVKQQLKQIQKLSCINHSYKKASYQHKTNPNIVYCHQCTILAVKQNNQVFPLSQHSYLMHKFLQKQLQIVNHNFQKINQIIQLQFNKIKQNIFKIYQQAQQFIVKQELFKFCQFKIDLKVVQEILNKNIQLTMFKAKFINQEEINNKENKNYQNYVQTYNKYDKSMPKYRQNSIQLRTQSHRSIKSTNLSKSPLQRSRQNSYISINNCKQKKIFSNYLRI